MGFRRLLHSTDGTPLDLTKGPAVLELTPIGELVIHNWDREADEAAVALGLPPVECLVLSDDWWEFLVGAFFHNWRDRRLPRAFYDEINKVGRKTIDDVFAAAVRTGYNLRNSNWGFSLHEIRKSGLENVRSALLIRRDPDETIESHVGVELNTTFEALFELLDLVPHGLILDEVKKQWLMAAAVRERPADDLAIVTAGEIVSSVDDPFNPLPFSVESQEALVQRSDNGIWVLRRWVTGE